MRRGAQEQSVCCDQRSPALRLDLRGWRGVTLCSAPLSLALLTMQAMNLCFYDHFCPGGTTMYDLWLSSESRRDPVGGGKWTRCVSIYKS